MVNVRAAVFIGLAAFVGLLDIIGVAVPMMISDSFPAGSYTRTSGSTTMVTRIELSFSANAFRTCQEQAAITTCSPPTAGCGGVTVTESCSTEDPPDCLKGGVYAIRAFGIMSILVAFLGCVPLGVLDLLGKSPLADKTKFAMAGCAGVLLFFEIIFWVCFFIVWNKQCPELGNKSYSELDPVKVGAGPIIFIVTSVLTIPLIIVAMVVPGAPGGDATKPSDLDNMMTPMNTQQGYSQQQQQQQPGGAFHDDL